MSHVIHPDGYERSDADPRFIAALALGLAFFLLLVPALLIVIYPGATQLGGIPRDLPQPGEPRLQTAPKVDLARLRANEDARLMTYGWVDRDHQIAHIPVARAMEIIAGRGLAGWPSLGVPSPTAAPSPR